MLKNKLILIAGFLIFALSIVINTAVSQEAVQIQPAEEDAAVPEDEEVLEPKGVLEPDEETEAGNVTMDFKNADINNVLRILSYKSGVNIVAGPEVEGLVTIRLTNVPWEKALDVVLRTYGFAYERVGNIIRVTTTESLKQEELTTEIFTLSYSKAEEINEAIANMLTERGKTKFDERTNTLVVTDIPTNLYKISQIVAKLDRRTPQVMIEAKLIETTLDDDENLGIDWNAVVTMRGAARPVTFPFNRLGQGAFRGFDRFFGLGDTTAASLGAQSTGSTSSEFPTSTTAGGANLSPFPFADTDDFTFGTLDFSAFQSVLEYLETRTDTEILSNPRIATLNNQPANLAVGQIIGIPTYERNSDTGTMEITGYEEKEVGVILNVTPHVNVEGDISIDLAPEISELLRYDTLDESRGIVAPVFSTRTAETQVMLRDGETLMIGGLIKKTVSDSEDKVPLLGDLPWIGKALFTKTADAIDRTELIIFLTVHLVQEEWVPPAGSASVHIAMPVVKDEELIKAIPSAKVVDISEREDLAAAEEVKLEDETKQESKWLWQ